MAPPRPVTLRDFLELGCDSSSDGFRSYPRRFPRDDDAVAAAPRPQPKLEAHARLEVLAEAADALLRRSSTTSSSSYSPQRSPSLFSLPSPGALARISRSFSRRIREGLWRRRRFDDGDEEEAYFDDRDSCGFPSPLVSSCSASSDSDSEEESVVAAAEEKPASAPPAPDDREEQSSSSSSSSSAAADLEDCTGAASDGNKMQAVAEGGDPDPDPAVVGMEDDKQQLSPVSVLDFPFDDDGDEEEGSGDAGMCSPAAFQQRRPPPDLHIIRTKQQQQLAHKVRRRAYDPVDLDARFVTAASESESGESVGSSTRLATSSSTSTTGTSSRATATTAPRHDGDEEEEEEEDPEHQSVVEQPPPSHEKEPYPDDDEYRLFARLLLLQEGGFAACLADDEASRALVLDFFAEGADRLRRSGRRVVAEEDEEALVGAAAEWLRGAGPRWGVADVVLSGKAALVDTERDRRWMCVAGEEERDGVGAEVEGVVVDALVDELVTELAVPWWWWRRRHGDGNYQTDVCYYSAI